MESPADKPKSATSESVKNATSADPQLGGLKNKVEVEIDRQRLLRHKVETDTRDRQRKAKASVLREDLNRSKQSNDVTLEHADNLIKSYSDEIREGEIQYRDGINGYLMGLDDLNQFQFERFDGAYSHFQNQLQILNDEFMTERSQIMTKYRQEQEELGDALKRVEMDLQEITAAESQDWQNQQEDDKNKINEEKQATKILTEGIMEDLWHQFQTALNEYNESTKERRGQYDLLRKRDAENSAVIGEQSRKVLKLQDTIAALKAQYQSNMNDSNSQTSVLKNKKEMLTLHFQMMKRKMNQKRDGERKRLTEVAVEGKQVLKAIEAQAKQAAEIIRIASNSARFETDEDRYYGRVIEGLVDEKTQRELEEIEARITAQLGSTRVVTDKERQALRSFNARYNKVKLDCLTMDRERRVQQDLNRNLKLQLRHILNGMAVSEPILSDDNSLFMINSKSNVLPDVKSKISGPLNVLEGAIISKSYHKQSPSTFSKKSK